VVEQLALFVIAICIIAISELVLSDRYQSFCVISEREKEVDQRAIAVAKHIATVFRVHEYGAAANKWLNQAISFRQVLQQLRHNAGFTARPLDR
jgi:hypothetical protein